MRKLISLLGMMMCTVSIYAQKITSGSKDFLEKGDIICVKIDYSKAEIMGMSDSDYAVFETNWEPEGKKQQLYVFLTSLKKKCPDYKFTISNDAAATLVYYVNEITIQRFYGATCTGKVVIKTKDDREIVMDNVEESGKTFGTKLHIMEKAISELGESIGEELKK